MTYKKLKIALIIAHGLLLVLMGLIWMTCVDEIPDSVIDLYVLDSVFTFSRHHFVLPFLVVELLHFLILVFFFRKKDFNVWFSLFSFFLAGYGIWKSISWLWILPWPGDERYYSFSTFDVGGGTVWWLLFFYSLPFIAFIISILNVSFAKGIDTKRKLLLDN